MTKRRAHSVGLFALTLTAALGLAGCGGNPAGTGTPTPSASASSAASPSASTSQDPRVEAAIAGYRAYDRAIDAALAQGGSDILTPELRATTMDDEQERVLGEIQRMKAAGIKLVSGSTEIAWTWVYQTGFVETPPTVTLQVCQNTSGITLQAPSGYDKNGDFRAYQPIMKLDVDGVWKVSRNSGGRVDSCD